MIVARPLHPDLARHNAMGLATAAELAAVAAGATPADGSVTDAKVSAGAAIAQAKISGLVAQLTALVGADNAEAIARAAADTTLTANVASNTSAIATKAADVGVVHLAGAETITGVKTFPVGSIAKVALASLAIVDGDVAAISEGKVTNLVGDLAGKETPAGAQAKVDARIVVRLSVSATAPVAPVNGDLWIVA